MWPNGKLVLTLYEFVHPSWLKQILEIKGRPRHNFQKGVTFSFRRMWNAMGSVHHKFFPHKMLYFLWHAIFLPCGWLGKSQFNWNNLVLLPHFPLWLNSASFIFNHHLETSQTIYDFDSCMRLYNFSACTHSKVKISAISE